MEKKLILTFNECQDIYTAIFNRIKFLEETLNLSQEGSAPIRPDILKYLEDEAERYRKLLKKF